MRSEETGGVCCFVTDHYYALIGFGNEPPESATKVRLENKVERRMTKWPVSKKWPPEAVAALVRALLTAGADAAARDRDGKTAREIASEAGLTEAAAPL